MKKITTSSELKQAIHQLELEQAQLGIELHDQFNMAYNSLKPINLIKSVFKEVTGADDDSSSLLSNSLGFGAGYISKVLIQNILRRPLNRMIGTAVMFGLQTLVSRNPEKIKAIGSGIISFFRRRNRPSEDEYQNLEIS
ncbi:MAG: hypothetical protein CVT94_00540 [Bacteroidetes bacterium HGW-Bacteroidetes-11]|jgi:hypothetical protein|nr:MAG: hypothetical protein CVT94_00540 [Bacteroidetes bacterium HGW-Bacteroidetes-11]